MVKSVNLLKVQPEYCGDEKFNGSLPERFPVQEAGDSDNRTGRDSHRVLIVQNLRERDKLIRSSTAIVQSTVLIELLRLT